MSLRLVQGTMPEDLHIRFGQMPDDTVMLGDYEISLKDFLLAAHYVLTNSDLKPYDPRIQFVECVQRMLRVSGFNPGGERFRSSLPPIS